MPNQREINICKRKLIADVFRGTWQYFGTITCDGLHGIMKLYIDKS